MRHLNYTHLQYFWTVANEGTIARAAEVLHLTPQTISGQLKLLEGAVGQSLFKRVGRGLVLTETGRLVHQYADEIFMLGSELAQRVKSSEPLMPTTLNVGIVNSIPKLIALRVIEPALDMEEPMRVVCREGDLDMLLADLAVHRLDLVISDHALPRGTHVKAYNHRLGSSAVGFFVHQSRAGEVSDNLAENLCRLPLLMPIPSSSIRRGLEEWFDKVGVTATIVAEFDDSALLKAFGEAGVGAFPAPVAIMEEVKSMYHSVYLGEAQGVVEEYFAISPERKLKHPAVLRIIDHARQDLLSAKN